MTPRSLVGMTMGARRRRLWDKFFDDAWDGATISNFRTEAAKYRLGQRLRPCPGCPSCTDSSRLQVIGCARRIGGRVRIDRALDVSGRSASYVIMFSWRHVGEMHKLRGFRSKQLAWEHMHEYLQSRGHLPGLCEGTGVLLARAKMREVRRCRQ